MSILIKGMTMPKNGHAMGILLYPNGDAYILSNEIPVTRCKAVELPPHGRLIDADWLKEHMRNKYENGPFGWNPDEFDVLAVIDDTSTIIEAEE